MLYIAYSSIIIMSLGHKNMRYDRVLFIFNTIEFENWLFPIDLLRKMTHTTDIFKHMDKGS